MAIPKHLTAESVVSIIDWYIQERQSELVKKWKDEELSKLTDSKLLELRDKYAGKK